MMVGAGLVEKDGRMRYLNLHDRCPLINIEKNSVMSNV